MVLGLGRAPVVRPAAVHHAPVTVGVTPMAQTRGRVPLWETKPTRAARVVLGETAPTQSAPTRTAQVQGTTRMAFARAVLAGRPVRERWGGRRHGDRPQ